MSYSLPNFDLTLPEWEAWTRAARSKRPVRALGKMWRAIVEALGLAKRGTLFEETFGITTIRVLRGAMEAHPVLVAAKSPQALSQKTAYAAAIAVEQSADRGPAGQRIALRVRVTNVGAATWRARDPRGVGHVTLGVQLLDADSRLLARDHCRVGLSYDVQPGHSAVLAFECPAPSTPGRYHLKFDLVAEGVTWFEATGSAAVSLPLIVHSASR